VALEYAPGSSLAHRLDPRSKFAVQLAMVALAFAYTTPIGLLAVTGVTWSGRAPRRWPRSASSESCSPSWSPALC